MLIDTGQNYHGWYGEIHTYYEIGANGVVEVDTKLGLPSKYQIYKWYGHGIRNNLGRKFEPGQPLALEILPILNAGRKHVCL